MKSNVYFIPLSGKSTLEERVSGVKSIIKLNEIDAIIRKQEFVAIKVHVGEKKNTTHVRPELVKPFVEKIKRCGALPFLTETSTLYKGERSNAVKHLNLAYEHGFTPQNVGAPFIMSDGLLGNTEVEVGIMGKIYSKVNVAKEIVMADAVIVISHATGHIGMGFGGAIKNTGMGLSSRKGKMTQHSSIKPYIDEHLCTYCKKCIKWCPEEAIITKIGQKEYAFIVTEKCIGCGECLSVCGFHAVQYDWELESGESQRRMAEHASGVLSGKTGKSYFINFLTDMTKDCDCVNENQSVLIPDIGILASTDIVAIDQATLDLTGKKHGINLGKLSYNYLDPEIHIEHAALIGLGSREYSLVEIK